MSNVRTSKRTLISRWTEQPLASRTAIGGKKMAKTIKRIFETSPIWYKKNYLGVVVIVAFCFYCFSFFFCEANL